MTDHPLTPDPVKEYIDEQNIEKVINTGINKVLRERPTDALSALAVFLTSNAEKKPIFSRFECEETIIKGEFRSFVTQVFIDYAGENKCRHTHTYSFEAEDFSEGDEGQASFNDKISKAMEIITTDINELLANKDLSLIKKTDIALQKYFEEKYALIPAEGEGEEATPPDNQDAAIIALKVCSEALIHGIAKCFDSYNTFNGYGTLITGSEVDPNSFTKLMFTVLNGGKAVSSKVKFAKIYLILGATRGVSTLDTFLNIQKAITSAIAATKAGANGFKVGADGSFFNACEGVNDSLKILEDAINNAGCNTESEIVASIGINCESHGFYNSEQNKYDIEGPKNLFEPEQLCDWYIKLLNDHPLVTYLEDPFAEKEGYQAFPAKLTEGGLDQKVKFGLKTFYKGSIETLKEHTEFFEKEEEDEEAEGEGEEEKKEETPEGEGEQPEEEKKETPDEPPAEGEGAEPEPEDPNKDKFHINILHIDRNQYKLFSDILDFQNYGNSQKAERKFGVIVQDNFYESSSSDIVDLALGMNATFLNIKGVKTAEKLAKVLRYNTVSKRLIAQLPEPEPQEEEPQEEFVGSEG